MLYDNCTCPCPVEDVKMGLCHCINSKMPHPADYGKPQIESAKRYIAMTREEKIQQGAEKWTPQTQIVSDGNGGLMLEDLTDYTTALGNDPNFAQTIKNALSFKPTTAELIAGKCDQIKAMLLEKNRKYGDSALSEGVVFPLSPVLSLKSRINDKLARLRNDNKDEDEDVLKDLCGYIILLQIAIEKEKK
jgi:hypothetical protein